MWDWIGYRWLIDRHGLAVTQALRAETVIGPSRALVSDGTTERRTVQELLRPEATLAAHLGFALKHEGVHLEALSRLFEVAPAAELEAWIRGEPTGQYARRAGFLFERLTGRVAGCAGHDAGKLCCRGGLGTRAVCAVGPQQCTLARARQFTGHREFQSASAFDRGNPASLAIQCA